MTVLRNRSPWDRAAVHRALLLALAAWIAFAVAATLHVHNAYWAAMPVWVIGQPARGVLVERAIFRVIGTLVGAAVGFALVHVPAPPGVQILLLALWIALNTGTTHVLRGVHGYGALLAGMTAAVVVIPSLLAPSGSMAIALARVHCTLIGVVVGSLVLAFQTPESPLAEFYDEIRAVSAEAVAHAASILRGGPVDLAREERRILGLISELEASARLHSAGSVEGYRRLGDVDLLVVGSLWTLAAARTMRDGHGRCDAALPDRLEAIAGHLGRAWTQPLAEAARRLPIHGDPALARLDRAIGDILAADQALARAVPVRAPGPGAWLAPHREWALAWRAGALAGTASFAAMGLALALPAPSLGLAALGVCIFVMVLGSMPLPQLVAPKLIAGVACGVLAAVFYRLALQPGITGPAALLCGVVPFLVAGGLIRAHPRLSAMGVDFSMCFLLASQAGMPATHDTARVLMDSGALLASAGLMAALFYLLPRRVHRQAVDAAAVIRRDLQRILEAGEGRAADWSARGSRQILRLSLHLGRAGRLGRRWPEGLLAVLNLGQAMIDLQELGMPPAVQALAAAALRRELPPRAAADALRVLAQGDPDEPARRMVLRLADTLGQSAELLGFGLPA